MHSASRILHFSTHEIPVVFKEGESDIVIHAYARILAKVKIYEARASNTDVGRFSITHLFVDFWRRLWYFQYISFCEGVGLFYDYWVPKEGDTLGRTEGTESKVF